MSLHHIFCTLERVGFFGIQDPVVTPDGYMYSKEAIYESLLAQKKANKRKLAAWEEQQRGEDRKVWIHCEIWKFYQSNSEEHAKSRRGI